jgi:hypothetical protein
MAKNINFGAPPHLRDVVRELKHNEKMGKAAKSKAVAKKAEVEHRKKYSGWSKGPAPKNFAKDFKDKGSY